MSGPLQSAGRGPAPWPLRIQQTALAQAPCTGEAYLFVGQNHGKRKKGEVGRMRRKGEGLLTFEDPLRKGRFPFHQNCMALLLLEAPLGW